MLLLMKAYMGKKVTADDIFSGRTSTTAEAVTKLKNMLQEKAPK